MRTRLLVLPAAGALLMSMAAPASATVTVSPGGSVSGDAANDYIAVTCAGGNLSASAVTAGEACASLTMLSVDPGDGTDTVTLGDLQVAQLPGVPFVSISTAEAGVGSADTVTGSPLGDVISGDSLDTVTGGDGGDLIDGANSASGGPGDDTFLNIASLASGGDGDDRFVQFSPLGGIEGGAGTDSWELDFDQILLGAGSAGLVFSMSPGGLAVDVVGDAVPSQTFPAAGLEQVYVTMLKLGPQTWDGSAFAGYQHVRGVAGPDVVTGGSADDALFGGTGADTVTGGGGSDVLHGGDDNDTVNARDGVSDRVDCGAGTDTVVADPSDVVVGCESVQLPPVVTPTPPAPTAPVVPTTGKVKGPVSVAKGTTAKFKLSSANAAAIFQCKVDKGGWKSCTSPYKVKTRKLALGKHKLSVRAVLAGVTDPTPSVRKFRVVRSS